MTRTDLIVALYDAIAYHTGDPPFASAEEALYAWEGDYAGAIPDDLLEAAAAGDAGALLQIRARLRLPLCS